MADTPSANPPYGTQALALPDGQNTPAVGQYAMTKIFAFTEFRL
jgi:hypothetical protein